MSNLLGASWKVPKSHLWDFLQFLLNDPTERFVKYIQWRDRYAGIFKIIDPTGLAHLWGSNKNLTGMTYDKLSRSLRNYYKNNRLKKVPGQRQVYQFIFSQDNPPQIDPKIGQLIEQTNRMQREMLLQQVIPQLTQLSSSKTNHQLPEISQNYELQSHSNIFQKGINYSKVGQSKGGGSKVAQAEVKGGSKLLNSSSKLVPMESVNAKEEREECDE